MAITIDRDNIQTIASRCIASSNTIQSEAATMQAQMVALREALAGIPNLALADKFTEWQQLFGRMSTALEESNRYLNGVIQTVDTFVASLGQA